MDNEMIKIFNENQKAIGIASRSDVHKFGYWHETFHCWLIAREENNDYIYFQLRSPLKKDYPNLLDITAAGHLLADETVDDGIREVEEELGITVSMNELISLGVLKYSIQREDFIDNEIMNVFLYKNIHSFHEFRLQKEEVAGLYRVDFTSFSKLWSGEIDEIQIEGFETNSFEEHKLQTKVVTREAFVPHGHCFYSEIIKRIQLKLE